MVMMEDKEGTMEENDNVLSIPSYRINNHANNRHLTIRTADLSQM
jgi:hypothetical protein